MGLPPGVRLWDSCHRDVPLSGLSFLCNVTSIHLAMVGIIGGGGGNCTPTCATVVSSYNVQKPQTVHCVFALLIATATHPLSRKLHFCLALFAVCNSHPPETHKAYLPQVPLDKRLCFCDSSYFHFLKDMKCYKKSKTTTLTMWSVCWRAAEHAHTLLLTHWHTE